MSLLFLWFLLSRELKIPDVIAIFVVFALHKQWNVLMSLLLLLFLLSQELKVPDVIAIFAVFALHQP